LLQRKIGQSISRSLLMIIRAIGLMGLKSLKESWWVEFEIATRERILGNSAKKMKECKLKLVLSVDRSDFQTVDNWSNKLRQGSYL